MIVDSSALVAILFKEKEAAAFAAALQKAPSRALAAPTLVETAIVAEGRTRPEMSAALDDLLRAMRAEIVPFTATHAAIARDGWRRFGKGRHKAGLNLGDCFAYALAIERDEPLLFKGDDFAQTDVKRAL
ncbi:type II toxin-antitoxin system VapC family toxin [Falsiroseomonas oryzae]|uniref:type II toxin-antitoxin system VapC family toxin n=1 Tax=Falsiroseomonas oryzae TaxID=2766473 RepID=UPI0022EAD8F1|nr:type II toxin-antitoxin system VapC family toxin [Roseomonas sp. MO-31]